MLTLNLFVFSMIGLVLKWNLDNERAQATQLAGNLGRVLEENLSRFVDKVDLTLLSVIDEIERQERAGGIDPKALEAFLGRHDSRLPEALGVRVADAKGIIRHAASYSGQAIGVSVADREYFLRHRDMSARGLFISQPIIGKFVPEPLIIFSRRRAGPDATFLGTVHVAVPIRAISEMFAAVDVGRHGSVGLWDEAPLLLARHSPIPAPTSGVSTPSARLRELVAARAPPTPYTTISGVDGLERVFFYRQIEARPLFMVIGLSSEDFLADWRREAAYLAGLAGVFLMASIGAFLVIQRAVSQLDQAREEADTARRRGDLILSSVGEGICGIDAAGQVIFINSAAKRMLGWAEDEGLGLNLHEAAHHHHADGTEYDAADCPVGQLVAGSLAPRPLAVSEEVFWRKDGTSFPVDYTAAPIVEDGRIIGAVNVFRDASQRRQAETSMARALATTQVMGNCLRLSLESLSLDQTLDLALKELLSLPWLNIENRGCVFVAEGGELRMAARRNLTPDVKVNCARVRFGHCLCGAAASTREIVFADRLDQRHSSLGPDMADHGHYCVPIIAGEEVLGVLNTYVPPGHKRDPEEDRFLRIYAHTLAGIIKRKRAEEDLRASENLSKTLINATADAAVLLDRDGIILAANEAMAGRFGAAAASLAGSSFLARLSPEKAELWRDQLRTVFESREPLHAHEEMGDRSLDNRAYPVLSPDGEVEGVAIYSRDVTDSRRAARAVQKAVADLEASNAELEQFAYVASHDLRQPLRMISGYLSLIQRRLGDKIDDDMREFFGFAVGGAKRMDALILDLLEYSRIGRADSDFETVVTAEILRDARLNLEAAIGETGAEIVEGPGPETLLCERNQMVRLFQNLIGNAIKYRDPERPPRIEISWSRETDGWRASVADNGTGIAQADHERAFGIFKRLVAGDKIEGNGIGLSICKKIVERHGGRIWIESELGRGSTFHFTIKDQPA